MTDPFAPVPGVHQHADAESQASWLRPGHPGKGWRGRRRVDLTDGPQSVTLTAERRAELRAEFPRAFGLTDTQMAALAAEADRLGMALDPDTKIYVPIVAPGTPPPTPAKPAGQMMRIRRWWRRKTHRCENCTTRLVRHSNARLCQACRDSRSAR